MLSYVADRKRATDMNPLTRLARRGRRPVRGTSAAGLGGATEVPGALTTLEIGSDAPADPPTEAAPPTDTGRPDLAGDRFTVDPSEWADLREVEAPEPPAPVAPATTTPWRLLLRLVLVVVLSLVAFHHTVATVVDSIASGSVLVYVLAVPVYAGLAAAANNRRPGYQPASGVRWPDVVLGTA